MSPYPNQSGSTSRATTVSYFPLPVTAASRYLPAGRAPIPTCSSRSRRACRTRSSGPAETSAQAKAPARLEPRFAEQINEPSRARCERRVIQLELHRDFFQPLGQRGVVLGRGCTFLLQQPLDVLEDFRQQLLGSRIHMPHAAEFFMQFAELIAQEFGIHDSSPQK